jgi:ABC-type polysaccharide/polyol phosphate export permease
MHGSEDVLLSAYARSACEFGRTIVARRRLLAALARRELSDEYVSQSFSMSWPIIHPLVLMAVYVFVFTSSTLVTFRRRR